MLQLGALCGHAFTMLTHAALMLQLGVLYGHASPVTCVRWGPLDATLLSGAADGMVYSWRLRGMRRIYEHRIKGVPITSISLQVCFTSL